MDLLFLYGPPAVGKLTVAKAVASFSGYRVFHNHLAFDLAAALFEPFSAPFSTMLQQIRLLGLQAAMEGDISGLIMTMCYDHPSDLPIVEEIEASLLQGGGRVQYVHLFCDISELRKRVESPDRRQYRKLTRAEKLDGVLQKWNLFTSIPNRESFRIDTTRLSASEVADKIAMHFHIDAKLDRAPPMK